MFVLYMVIGFVALIFGAEALVRGSSRLAAIAKISPLVIGLTIVAFGTSAPEMAVSIFASLKGQPDIAVGNVVGSNIFNILFILGVTAAIAPLTVAKQLIRLDVPIMIFVSVLVYILAFSGHIGRIEGGFLFAGILGYTAFLIIKGRKDHKFHTTLIKEAPASTTNLIYSATSVLVGFALLVIGSRWLVAGAVEFATILGVSKLVIGLTIVAAGTSLPEAATSIVAGLRGERDIAVGNIVGSNIFNILAVLGLSAAVSKTGVAISHEAVSFDIPVMVATAVICLPVFFTKGEISRWEGSFFLIYYGLYVTLLIFKAKGMAQYIYFQYAVIYFVLPLTGVAFLVSLIGSINKYEQAMEAISKPIQEMAFSYLLYAKRLIIIVFGFTVLAIGVAMFFLPGPAIIVIPLGLAILGTEFVWARRLLNKVNKIVESASKKIKSTIRKSA